MKAQTYTDDLYATKLLGYYERHWQRHDAIPIRWGFLCFWYGLALCLFVTWAFADQIDSYDFTDTGVGCIEDCLEPADTEVEPVIWKA